MKSHTHRLVQDGDCHWYVIPADKKTEWDEWCDLPEPDYNAPEEGRDFRAWQVPDFAVAVGGHPSLVTFTEDGYTIA